MTRIQRIAPDGWMVRISACAGGRWRRVASGRPSPVAVVGMNALKGGFNRAPCIRVGPGEEKSQLPVGGETSGEGGAVRGRGCRAPSSTRRCHEASAITAAVSSEHTRMERKPTTGAVKRLS